MCKLLMHLKDFRNFRNRLVNSQGISDLCFEIYTAIPTRKLFSGKGMYFNIPYLKRAN